MFGYFYVMAMTRRKKSDVHARWMICTAFTMLDPIFARVILVNFYQVPIESGVVQWMTFALIDVIVITLVIKDWKSSKRRDVFLPALALLALAQIAMLTAWKTAPWQAFASWFAGLSLT
jgi:chromate transport protein ChrA